MFPRSLRLPRRKHARGTPSAKARVRAPGGIHRHTVAVGGLRRWLELAHARPAARPPSAIRFAGVIGGVKAHRHDERRFQADDLGSVAYFRQLRATAFFSDQCGCGTSSKCGRRSVESQHSRKIGPGVAAAMCGRAGGTLLLYDKKVTPHFRADGHSWAKKRNGVSIKESHEKLRVNSEFVLSCCYSRGADDGRFRVRKATSNAARFQTA